MIVRMRQHPVGQGGLFSGTLASGTLQSPRTTEFRWVYDCGSNQRMCLDREIDEIAARGPINVLFFSHLDSDHVNGVARLLESVDVHEVVLPYLQWPEKILLLAAGLSEGTYSADFTDFIEDPAAWLLNRGALRVTFIDEGSTPTLDGPSLPSGEPGGDGEPGGHKWLKPPSAIEGEDANVGRVDASNTISIVSRVGLCNWVLVPHVCRPSASALQAFKSSLPGGLRSIRSMKRLKSMLIDKDSRDRLRDCYENLWADHNLVSMSLYSGPHTRSRWQVTRSHAPDFWYREAIGSIGWISTGDANLKRQGRRKQFLHHYSRLRDHVGCLVVPHHGAADSFHPEILYACPNLHTSLAAAGRNAYGHPHDEVRYAGPLGPYGLFHVVGEPSDTVFEVRGQV